MLKDKTRIAFTGDMFSIAVSFKEGIFTFEPLQSLSEPPRPSFFLLDEEDCIPGADLAFALEVLTYADDSLLSDYEGGIDTSLELFLFIIEECMREGLPYC